MVLYTLRLNSNAVHGSMTSFATKRFMVYCILYIYILHIHIYIYVWDEIEQAVCANDHRSVRIEF